MIRELLTPSRRDRNFLDLALKLAGTSDCPQKHGAVVVKSGRVLSLGVNKERNDPRFVESDTPGDSRGTIFSIHAEVDALSRVKNAEGSILYVARLSRTGVEAFSRPCDFCAIALKNAGVKAICYT